MNLDAIRKQCDLIGQLRDQLHAANQQIEKVSGKHGQSTAAAVTVNGVAFNLLALSPAYMPMVVKGCEVMQQEAIRLCTANRDRIKSQLEGAEWKLRQLSKSQPTT